MSKENLNLNEENRKTTFSRSKRERASERDSVSKLLSSFIWLLRGVKKDWRGRGGGKTMVTKMTVQQPATQENNKKKSLLLYLRDNTDKYVSRAEVAATHDRDIDISLTVTSKRNDISLHNFNAMSDCLSTKITGAAETSHHGACQTGWYH